MKDVHPIYLRSKATVGSRELEFVYPSGLRWGCARCGACCRDPPQRPRRVLLLPGDLQRLAEGGVDVDAATRRVEGEPPFAAEMTKFGGRCVLLGDGECRAYQSRALLCRMYPFWVEKQGDLLIVRHDEDCPGFGSGEPVTEDSVRRLLSSAVQAMES